MLKLYRLYVFYIFLFILGNACQSRKLPDSPTLTTRGETTLTDGASEGGVEHKHEEIFLPLKVEADGTVDGLMIEDNEAEKGPLVIEEIVNESGDVTEVIIERASDLTPDRIAQRQSTNRKLGFAPPAESKEQIQKKKPNRLPLVLFLISAAFVLGFLLSGVFWRSSSMDRLLLDKKTRLALEKKLSLNPQPWKEDKDLYSPTSRSVRSPTFRSARKYEKTNDKNSVDSKI